MHSLHSGLIWVDEEVKVETMICNLKGLPSDEWNYEPSD